jgi:hypothetical protein
MRVLVRRLSLVEISPVVIRGWESGQYGTSAALSLERFKIQRFLKFGTGYAETLLVTYNQGNHNNYHMKRRGRPDSIRNHRFLQDMMSPTLRASTF